MLTVASSIIIPAMMKLAKKAESLGWLMSEISGMIDFESTLKKQVSRMACDRTCDGNI
jgi:hypothetical protein